MLKAGVGANVIPSEAEATLDVRALPDENIPAFYQEMAKVINDPAVRIVPLPATRPPSPPSRLDTEMYRVMERVAKQMYPRRDCHSDHEHRCQRQSTAPSQRPAIIWSRASRHAKRPNNFGAHSDVERLPESLSTLSSNMSGEL